MCVVCYIATDKKIQEISFNEKAPAFHIEKEKKVVFHKEVFSLKHIYYIGSHQGCGCGFTSEELPQEVIDNARKLLKKGEEFPWQYWEYFKGYNTAEQVEETIAERQKEWGDTQKLYNLMAEIVADCGKVECLICWSGTEEKALDDIIKVSLSSEKLAINFREARDKNIKFIIRQQEKGEWKIKT